MLTTKGNSLGASTGGALVCAGFMCLMCLVLAATAFAAPLQFGTIDEDKEQQRLEAQKAIKEAGISLDVNGASVVKLGSSYAVDQGETVDGDVVIIGGALTVEGTINGDAAVIGGSMYLASSSVIKGDAVVIGGILQKEEGAVVMGKTVENPEKTVHLAELEHPQESPNVRVAEPGKPGEPPQPPEAPEGGLTITSHEGDIVKISEAVHVAKGEVVKGDVVTVSADITIDGEVQGDVVATSGNIHLGPTAKVGGDVAAVFGEVEMAEGAEVKGDVVKTDLTGKHVIAQGKPQGQPEGGAVPPVAPSEAAKPTGEMVTYNVSLYAPDAKDVRLTGSFINWDSEGIKMARDSGGTWRTTYSYAPGTYLYKFVVDGKAIPDPDVPDAKVSDGMGGYATQLVVRSKSTTMIPIRFSLKRPEAADVRVTGSFNNWDPDGIKMSKDAQGTWSATVPIAPGNILYKFYIDGTWGPDPDVAETAPDGMGGQATPFTIKAPTVPTFKFTAGTGAMEKAGTNFTPALDYNRVDGIYLALILSNKTNLFPQPRFYLEGGHSKLRHRWLYTFEIEQPLLAPFLLSVGGSLYDKTDSYDKGLISDGENFLAAGFFKRDYRDYFDRRGVTGFAEVRPLKCNSLKVYYCSDEYRALETKAHAAVFRRHAEFEANPRNSDQICYNPDADAVTCDKLVLKSMGVAYELDTRDCNQTPSTGIWARLGSEWAGRSFGGDLDFTRYTADLRFYNRISAKQKYALRLMAGGLDIPADAHCGCTPGPEYFFPKEFYVGGIGTLPGYSFKEFQGTRMLLLNTEYVYFLKGGMGVLFFVDGGDAGTSGTTMKDAVDAVKMRFDAGVGLRIERSGNDALTLGLARRLDDSSRDMVVTVRASRPF